MEQFNVVDMGKEFAYRLKPEFLALRGMMIQILPLVPEDTWVKRDTPVISIESNRGLICLNSPKTGIVKAFSQEVFDFPERITAETTIMSCKEMSKEEWDKLAATIKPKKIKKYEDEAEHAMQIIVNDIDDWNAMLEPGPQAPRNPDQRARVNPAFEGGELDAAPGGLFNIPPEGARVPNHARFQFQAVDAEARQDRLRRIQNQLGLAPLREEGAAIQPDGFGLNRAIEQIRDMQAADVEQQAREEQPQVVAVDRLGRPIDARGRVIAARPVRRGPAGPIRRRNGGPIPR